MKPIQTVTVRRTVARTEIEFTRVNPANGAIEDRQYIVKTSNRGMKAESLIKTLRIDTTFIFAHSISIILETP